MINPSTKANLAAHGHDQRVDLVRGIAIWFLLLDHIPHNIVNLLTLRNFGFSGAADLFVFVSGYAAAILFGKMTLERGFVITTSQIIKRVGKLYAAHLVMFVIYLNTIGWVAARYGTTDIIEQYHVIGILNDPVRVLMHGLLLLAKPLNLDVLQLLITLLAFFPFALVALLRWPNLTLVGSIALYLAARLFDIGPPAYPRGAADLNPLCWQLLFVLGAWFALNGRNLVRALYGLPALRILALSYLLFALVVTVASRDAVIGRLVPDFVLNLFAPNDRENLEPDRVLHFLLLALVFVRLVPSDWSGLRWKLLQPVIKCGEEWLATFCAGVFLSFAGHLVLITGPNSLAMQVLVSAGGLAAMTAVAYYVSWSKRQDHKSALGAHA